MEIQKFIDIIEKTGSKVGKQIIIDNIFFNCSNIRYEQILSKKKRIFYRWFATINNVEHPITMHRKNRLRVYAKVYCLHCGKLINEKLDLFASFKLKFNNTLTIFNAFIYCKKCSGYLNAKNSVDKVKQTCLERYGVDSFFKTERFKTEKIENLKLKFGDDYKSNKEYKQLHNPFKNGWTDPETGIWYKHNGHSKKQRENMVKGWKENRDNKSQEEISKWLKSFIAKRRSKVSIEFYKDLELILGTDNIKPEHPIRQYHIDVIYKNKIGIEFYGDYYHANPKIYKPDDIINIHAKSKIVKSIWENDHERIKKIQKLSDNLPIIIVWEKDYRTQKDYILNKIKEILEIIKKGETIYAK